MILSGETRRTCRQSCPSGSFATTKLILTDLLSNMALHADSATNNRLSHGVTKESTRIRPFGFKDWVCRAQ